MNHPEIDWAERTGYPSYNQDYPVLCDECGCDLTDEVIYEDDAHSNLCKTCLLMLHTKDW